MSHFVSKSNQIAHSLLHEASETVILHESYDRITKNIDSLVGQEIINAEP